MRCRPLSFRTAASRGSPASAADSSGALRAGWWVRRTGLSLCLALAFATPAGSDTVHLKGGRTLRVAECRPAGAELKCSGAGGTVGIPLDQVESVEKEARPPAPRPARTAPSPAPIAKPPAEPLEPETEGAGAAGSGMTSEAIRARIDRIETALAGPGGDSPALRHELAALLTLAGNEAMLAHDYDGAVVRYRSALLHDPRLTVARLNLCTALIDLSRPGEAEDLLKSLLDEQPDNARALFLLGEAAMQEGRPEEAVALWERSLALKPTDAVRSRLERARRLARAEEGFRRADGAHFTLKFDGEQASPDLAEEILSYLEEAFADLSGRFAHYPQGVVRVTLYSRNAFKEATASPDWVGGLFDGEVRLPVGGLSHLTPQVRHVLMHELTHCFVTSKSHGNAPQWIQEGIAQVMEGRSAASSRDDLRRANEALGGPGAAEFSYPRALSQVEFFLRTWSDSHLNDLLDHLGRGTDIDTSLKAVTGLSYQEFLAAWGESLQG